MFAFVVFDLVFQ